MRKKKIIIGTALWAAAAAAVLVPCFKLFEEGDWLFYVVRDAAMKNAWIETGILALLTAGILFLFPNRKARVIALGVLLLLVSYLHSMLLPALAAAVWFLLVLANGGLVRGAAAVIIAAAVLSLFRKCTPVTLAVVAAAMAAMNQLPVRKERAQSAVKKLTGWFEGNSPAAERLFTGIVFLVVLVQIARANSCIDFDSLWYGVRSTAVLAPNGNIFEDLGLVGMVYTYPKGFEILTLPLSGSSSYAVISAFNLCLFLYGLRETGRTAELLAGSRAKKPAMLLTAMVPGIVNMTLSAKPDVITWVLQMVMLRIFFETVRSAEKTECAGKTVSAGTGDPETACGSRYGALRVLAVYLFSLTMKPTALIFSTALFGMMSIYGLILRRKRNRNISRKPEGAGNLSEWVMSEQKQAAETAVLKEKEQKTAGQGKAAAVSALVLSAAALCVTCIRTYRLTGMPFTSVFTGIFEKLGFTLKYPFAASDLPRSYQEGSAVVTALKRAVKMLLMPDGKDMSHVIIAWGGSLFFVLGVVILLGLVSGIVSKREKRQTEEKQTGKNNEGVYIKAKQPMKQAGAAKTERMDMADIMLPSALTVFLPFIAVCFVTLAMLYQVDGNYYMTLYSIVIFMACMAGKRLFACRRIRGEAPGPASAAPDSETENCPGPEAGTGKAGAAGKENRLWQVICMLPAAAVCVFQFVIMTMTNWAGTTGFTEIRLNRGYYDHTAYYRELLTSEDGTIYDILAADPSAKLVAFGTHPDCLQFKCIAESYNDITSPWGNVELVNSAEAFEEYLYFMDADYVYADENHLSEEAWQWSKGLLEEMTADGTLTDFIYEGDSWLAKVSR